MTTHLSSRRVLLEDGSFHEARLTIHQGRIASIDPLTNDDLPSSENMLVPGFIDLQVNGIDDVDVWATALQEDTESWKRIEGLLLDQGVTSWCPTLVTGPLPRYQQALNFLGTTRREKRSLGNHPYIFGVHLEGPFLGPVPGAHRVEYIQELKLSSVLDVISNHAQDVAIMTLGTPGGDAGADLLSQVCAWLRQQAVVVSLGHCRPTRLEFERAFDSGATLVTHLFNAMSGIHHREGGLAAWALTDPRARVTMIADGIHVSPEMIALTFAAKPQGVALITDSVAWRGTTAGVIKLTKVASTARLPDGTLAGSVITMPESIRVCVQQAGIAVDQAVLAATATPAKILGSHDRGVFRIGARADVVALNDNFEVMSVYLSGRKVR